MPQQNEAAKNLEEVKESLRAIARDKSKIFVQEGDADNGLSYRRKQELAYLLQCIFK